MHHAGHFHALGEACSCYLARMGRIIVTASMENGVDSSFRIESDAVVDLAGHRLAKLGRVDLKAA